jgi:hypothetical protein
MDNPLPPISHSDISTIRAQNRDMLIGTPFYLGAPPCEPPAYGEFDENNQFVPFSERLPPFSNDAPPKYCPPYYHICRYRSNRSACIVIDGNLDDEVWEISRPPVDAEGNPIPLYIGRRVYACILEDRVVNSCATYVVNYDTPHPNHLAIIVEEQDTEGLHTLLIPKEWVDDELRAVIEMREGRGELELDWGPLPDGWVWQSTAL